MFGSISMGIELSKYRFARDRLLEAFPLVDEETLRDSLE
jgi:hypothetical protein